MSRANKELLSLVVGFLLALGTCQAGPNSKGTGRNDTTYVLSKSQMDSISNQLLQLREKSNAIEHHYISILEKTNNQLSLWWNPYGIFVAMVGILLTLLAIAATVIIFRQGSSYRRMLTESIASYRNVIDKFIEEKKADLDIKIKDTETKIANATDDQRKQLEVELSEFRKVKDDLSKSVVTIPTLPSGSFGPIYWPTGSFFQAPVSGSVIGTPYISNLWDKTVKCVNCQKEFKAHHPSSDYLVPSGTIAVNCPHCGHSNTVTF